MALIGSKVGRYLALGLLATATVAVIVARVFKRPAGGMEQLRSTQASLERRAPEGPSPMKVSATCLLMFVVSSLLDEWCR